MKLKHGLMIYTYFTLWNNVSAYVTKAESWECHKWTDEDKNDSPRLHDKQICERHEGRKYTWGQNDVYPGCGTCWCCRQAQATTTYIDNISTTVNTTAAASDKVTETTLLAESYQTQTIHVVSCTCATLCTPSSKWDFMKGMNLTQNQLKALLKNDLNQLEIDTKINKRNTTSYKNTKRSANDDRVSAAMIGYIAALVISTPIVMIIGLDVSRLRRTQV